MPRLIETLRELFAEVGDIIDIVARKNIKAKGQAFIVFDSIEEASGAIEMLQGFEVFGKPMELAYAKTRSDATVVREEGEDGLETHKRHRMAEKGMFILYNDWENSRELANHTQNANKQSKPRRNPPSVQQAKVSLNVLQKQPRPQQTLQMPLRTSIYHRTRFSSCETCQKTTAKKELLRSSAAFRASKKYERCLRVRLLHLWSMKTTMPPLLRRRVLRV